MRRLLCFLLVLLLPAAALAEAESDWANANLPQNRRPEYIQTVPLDEIEPTANGVHHYLLLCIDEWKSLPRPDDVTPPPLDEGRGPDRYGNTDGMVILTLDTAAHRIMLASIVRDAAILKPGSTDEKQYYGRINYIYNDFGPEALCKLISEHLGIRIEKYILFNFSQICDIIDLPSLDGVTVELNRNEITYLARYAVPRHTVISEDGYFTATGDPLNLHYVSKSSLPLDFSIPASVFTETKNGFVSEASSFDGPNGSVISFDRRGACTIVLPDGKKEEGYYNYEHERLAVMTGEDVWHNELAQPGKYHLGGHAALYYMRIRKSSRTDTDFMRTQRVRNVLSALADHCRVFTLDQANDLANSIMQHNDTTNMSLKEITEAASIAWSLRDCTIEEFRVPGQEDVRSITFGNMSALELNWTSIRGKYLDFLDHTTLVRDLDYVVSDEDD